MSNSLAAAIVLAAGLLTAPLPAQAEAPDATIRVGDLRVEVRADQARMKRGTAGQWTALAPLRTEILLRYARFDPTVAMPAIPPELRSAGNGKLWIVQFRTQGLTEYRDHLRELGAEVHAYLAHQAHVVRMPARLVPAVRRLDFVRWVGPLHPAFRLEEPLVQALGTRHGPLEAKRYNLVMIDPERDRAGLVADLGRLRARVTNAPRFDIYVEAELDANQLLAAANNDAVLWIDAATPIEFDVDNARIQGGANYIETKGGFTGKGVRGEILEGIYSSHTEFAATAWRSGPIVHRDGRASSHGNSTAGIVFSRGARRDARGLVPDGQLIYVNASTVSRSRASLARESVDPRGSYKSMFMTASWGNSRTLNYTSISSSMDAILFDNDIPETQSQSNSNTQWSRPQAWAKNMISIGGVRHRNNANPNDDYWSGASIGPAADGRIKPDLCAYYDGILTTSGSRSYTSSFGGTSGATPIVAGHVGLTVEMFTDGLFGYPAPGGRTNRFANRAHMTTTKALLINTARQYTFSGLNHNLTRVHQGWGFPHVGDMWDLRNRMLVLDETDVLPNRGSVIYWVWVPSGRAQLRATMTYADPGGTTNSRQHRINDLTLDVVAPNGTRYWGNQGLRANMFSTPGGSPDTKDTVENVFLKNPASGIYTVTVTAAEINRDSHVETPATDADFALVVSGIGAGRDKSGTRLDLSVSKANELTVAVTKTPAGWAEGWVFWSVQTARPLGTGNVFGLQFDALSWASVAVPAVAGSPFHFKTGSTNDFPNKPYAFPPRVALGLKGVALDAVALFADGSGKAISATNTARIKL